MACEALGVVEGGLEELFAHLGPAGGETLEVLGELHGLLHVLGLVLGDPLALARVVRDGLSDVGEKPIPPLRQHRHPHP